MGIDWKWLGLNAMMLNRLYTCATIKINNGENMLQKRRVLRLSLKLWIKYSADIGLVYL